MVSSQMLVPLIALLISSGALSDGNFECAYKNVAVVCQRINSAYRENSEVAQQLAIGFIDVRQGISVTNEAILMAARTAAQAELFIALHRALYKEVNVIFRLKLSCSGAKSETTECEAGFRGLSNVMQNLVYAMWEVADGKRRDGIDKAYNAFHKSVREGNMTVIDQAYELGIEVSNVIGNSLGTK